MTVDGVLLDHLADHQRGDVFRQLMGVGRVVGQQHFGDTCDFCRAFSQGANALPCYQHMDVAADFYGSRHCVKRGRGDGVVVVLSDYQDCH
ncbi:hypothetical protein D9M73_248150 [compost metagenome]